MRRAKDLLQAPDFGFELTPDYLCTIHKRLFEGVFSNAGCFRRYLIIWPKDYYPLTPGVIPCTLPYKLENIFSIEKRLNLAGLDAKTLAPFVANLYAEIWLLHPFENGNTRTTTIFIIKYLRALGYNVGNALFEREYTHFKTALTQSCFLMPGRKRTDKPLYDFFEKVILAETPGG